MTGQRIKHYPIHKIIGCRKEIYQLRIIEIDSFTNVEINLEDGDLVKELETISFHSAKPIEEIVKELSNYVASVSELKMTIANGGGIFKTP